MIRSRFNVGPIISILPYRLSEMGECCAGKYYDNHKYYTPTRPPAKIYRTVLGSVGWDVCMQKFIIRQVPVSYSRRWYGEYLLTIYRHTVLYIQILYGTYAPYLTYRNRSRKSSYHSDDEEHKHNQVNLSYSTISVSTFQPDTRCSSSQLRSAMKK